MLDTLIRGARVVDGTGRAAFTANVGLCGGVIEAVGELKDAQAFETIDAKGRVLTPGFIDIHRHADAAVFRDSFGGLRQGRACAGTYDNCERQLRHVACAARGKVCVRLRALSCAHHGGDTAGAAL